MALIDQRILIEAPAEAIWRYLVEPALVSKWNRHYKQISVLSTRPTGIGTRRRCVDESGRSCVEETTAWLENIGFETIAIDSPYRDYRARVRLQAIPEGVIVNWTVEYRLKGWFGALRSQLGHRAKLERTLALSLAELRQLVLDSGARIDPEKQARFAMRSAPDASLRPTRVPVQVVDEIPDLPAAPQPVEVPLPKTPSRVPIASAILEPAAVPTASVVVMHEEPALIPEPAFVDSVADTKPRKPTSLHAAIELTQPGKSAPVPTLPEVDPHQLTAPTVPIALVAPPREPEPETESMEIPVTPPPPTTLPEIDAIGEARSDKVTLPPPTGGRDTGEVSIWEIFQVERPSVADQTIFEEVISSTQPRFAEPIPPRSPRRMARYARVRPIAKSEPHLKAEADVRRTKGRRTKP
ncbi:MAG TPA: SRPBCC family protein [Aggregatilineales bacterium]|nr:SRPBCC family protein [Aggregatilineales bacterium]